MDVAKRRALLKIILFGGIVSLLFCSENIWSQESSNPVSSPEAIPDLGQKLDTMWTILASILVMFMQAGFAMVCSGLIRSKNTVNMCMKNVLDFSIGSIMYWLIGFGIMFGAGNLFFGSSGFMLEDTGGTFDSLSWANVPLSCKYFFQMVFSATAATIVAGAMGERTSFIAYLFYSACITGFIYPISGHWIWGGGWLGELGMKDFAGSTVVHSVGGWLALTGAIVVGPRMGKYNPDGTSNAFPGHNLPLVCLGTFILWFGWFGFNGGSTMALSLDISHIIAVTNIAAAAGGIAAMFTSWWMFSKPDLSMTFNGILGGLVSITAPCAYVSLGSAIWIGVLGGVLVVVSVYFIDQVLRVDDPVGAISVHGTCGLWGTLALGLFAEESIAPGSITDGLFFGGGWSLLGIQVLGVCSIFVWCMSAGFAMFYLLKVFIGLRVSPLEERVGLDLEEHAMESYSEFSILGIRL